MFQNQIRNHATISKKNQKYLFFLRYFFIQFVQTKIIMNQILSTKSDVHFRDCPRKGQTGESTQKSKNWFRFQFSVSIFIVLFLIRPF